MADKPPGRPLPYPYTYGAAVTQFPFKNYYQRNWVYKSWVLGTIICIPIFLKINQLVNSQEKKPPPSDHH